MVNEHNTHSPLASLIMKNIMKVRFLRHKEYFEKDLLLVSSYRFIIKIIDSLNPIVYNTNEEQKS